MKKKKYIVKRASILSIGLILILSASIISAAPILSIGPITGGFGVKTSITNTGPNDAIDVYWKITFTGGIIILGGLTDGTIAFIERNGGTEYIQTRVLGLAGIFGIGPVTVDVYVKEPTIPAVTASTPPGPTKILLFLTW